MGYVIVALCGCAIGGWLGAGFADDIKEELSELLAEEKALTLRLKAEKALLESQYKALKAALKK